MKQINTTISKFPANCQQTTKIVGFISQTRDVVHHNKVAHFYFLTKHNNIINIVYNLDTVIFQNLKLPFQI